MSGLNPFLSYKNVNHEYCGLLGSSVFRGFNNNFEVKEEDCGELILGLHKGESEGESEQEIFFNENKSI